MKIVGVTYNNCRIKEIDVTTDGVNRLKFVPKASLLLKLKNFIIFRKGGNI